MHGPGPWPPLARPLALPVGAECQSVASLAWTLAADQDRALPCSEAWRVDSRASAKVWLAPTPRTRANRACRASLWH